MFNYAMFKWFWTILSLSAPDFFFKRESVVLLTLIMVAHWELEERGFIAFINNVESGRLRILIASIHELQS